MTTDSTGFDTLWASGDPAALVDRTYGMEIQGSLKTFSPTFLLPPLILPKLLLAAAFDAARPTAWRGNTSAGGPPRGGPLPDGEKHSFRHGKVDAEPGVMPAAG